MLLIQENQPLFALVSLLFMAVGILLVLQYVMIRYGQRFLNQIIRYWVMIERYLGKHTRIIRFKNRHPKLYVILSQRFDIRHFYGLPFTLLLVVMSYILALFVGLVENVATLKPIVATDYFVSQQMSLLRDSDVINFFIQITSFASTPMTVLVMLLTIIICWLLRQRHVLIGLLVATSGSAAFTFLTKFLFKRERPADILLFEHTHSFPSGHATITIALYGFITYLLIRFNQNFAQRIHIIIFSIFFMLLVGLSRIVLNEHYLSDVLGGYLVGALWLMVGISVTEWLSAKKQIIWQVEWSISHVYMIWLSGAGIFISTLIYAEIYQFPLLSSL